MSSFHIVNAKIQKEYDIWLGLWQDWPNREVMAHPGYVKLFTRPCDKPLCAIMDMSEGKVLYPFISRPLSAEVWVENSVQSCDLITPYGYGGPFFWGRPSADTFWNCFDDWCHDNGVICFFMRLSLFEKHLLPIRGTVEEKLSNIVRSLIEDPESIWMDYEHKVRKNIKKAKRAGLEVIIDETGELLDEFLEIYYSTMQRRGASEQYYFDKQFFEEIIKDLKGNFVFFHILQERQVVSSELVLVSADNLYSFLGGTKEDAYQNRPNDILKHNVIEWGIKHSKESFVLGGGYENYDGIFKYKRSFAPHGEIPFKIAKLIYCSDSYEDLCVKRRDWERLEGKEWVPDINFFPAYRS